MAEIIAMRLRSFSILRILFATFLGLSLLAVYWNHFQNDFHFDDSHTIEDNPYIRNVKNIPKFFRDAGTFSVLATNQSYRPIITASLAVDYWMGGKLDPFYFHVSTFAWFLVLLVLLYFFITQITDRTRAAPSNQWVALFIVAWFGLHPVAAETVNYIIQRGDIYATLGVVAGFVIFQYAPSFRKLGLYLVPVAIGALAKPTAVMFAPMLFVYIILFECRSDLCFWRSAFSWRRTWIAIKRSFPALVVCGALYGLISTMTPPTFAPGGSSLTRYLLTQPFVHLHYLATLFVPTKLSVDTDWESFASITDVRAIAGFVFYVLLVATIFWTSRSRIQRPICFGLSWFVLALLPTTVVPLAEVTNDHRMFFPFIGLMLSLGWAIFIYSGALTRAAAIIAFLALPVYAYATMVRNGVWRTEESLWLDASLKSPNNGRALMNYGLTQMRKGQIEKAVEYFVRAEKLTPRYAILQVNLGVAHAALGRHERAEGHFQKSLAFGRNVAAPHYYYARWLNSRERTADALRVLDRAIILAPSDVQARHLQLSIFEKQQNWAKLRAAANDLWNIAPDERKVSDYVERANSAEARAIARAEENSRTAPTAESLVSLSLQLYRAGKYSESIEVANRAITLNPLSVTAYNNIGAASAALGRWSEAIEAAERALKIDPGFELAKNNLAWAKSQQKQSLPPPP